MKLIVSGSRSITNYELISTVLNSMKDVECIIEGGAKGIDSLAKKWALENDIKCIEVPAKWNDMSPPVKKKFNRYGKEYNALAGFKRNEEMVKLGDMLLAFWDGHSPGTRHMIEITKNHGRNVILVLVNENKIEVRNIKPAVETKVVNLRHEKYDVYIGRGSKWGNPFKIGADGTREEVIEKYRQYIMNRPDLLNDLKELRGKRLGCYCKPKPCHGDVLIELLEKRAKQRAKQ